MLHPVGCYCSVKNGRHLLPGFCHCCLLLERAFHVSVLCCTPAIQPPSHNNVCAQAATKKIAHRVARAGLEQLGAMAAVGSNSTPGSSDRDAPKELDVVAVSRSQGLSVMLMLWD
jgi:hypothetical protein